MVGAYNTQMRNACEIWFGKPERKRPRGRLRHRWEGNIGMDASGSGQGLVADSYEHGNERRGIA
jgi:hypothetical protein